MVYGKQKSEKITVTIPHDLKERVAELKDELHLSVSAIYKEALEYYLRKKEIERWEKGADMAARDKEYMDFVQEISSDIGDVYDYSPR